MSVFYLDFFFFFNDTATTEIYTLSLHDALPISDPVDANGEAAVGHFRYRHAGKAVAQELRERAAGRALDLFRRQDRKSTRLNSSHLVISYAVFCLKKKKTKK